MKGNVKVFVQFRSSLFGDWKIDLQKFKDDYKRHIGPYITPICTKYTKMGIYRKLDSMISFMEDSGYNLFLLHLNYVEYKVFYLVQKLLTGKYKSIDIKVIKHNSDWRYAWASQFFYDEVFNRIKAVKNLPENKHAIILNEATGDLKTIILSHNIKYNKRTFRKLSVDYRIISKWFKRGII